MDINFEYFLSGARKQYSQNTVKTREQLNQLSDEMIKIYSSMSRGDNSRDYLTQCESSGDKIVEIFANLYGDLENIKESLFDVMENKTNIETITEEEKLEKSKQALSRINNKSKIQFTETYKQSVNGLIPTQSPKFGGLGVGTSLLDNQTYQNNLFEFNDNSLRLDQKKSSFNIDNFFNIDGVENQNEDEQKEQILHRELIKKDSRQDYIPGRVNFGQSEFQYMLDSLKTENIELEKLIDNQENILRSIKLKLSTDHE